MRSTRFDTWPRWAAALMLALVALLVLWGLLTPHQQGYNDEDLLSGVLTYTDGQLYLDIADRVRAGENYYAAATELQRANDYPVRPAMTVREPTLAFMTAALGGETGMRIAMAVMVAIVMAAGMWRLERIAERRWEFWIAVLLLAAGAGHVLKGELVVTHDAWAGMFIVLSLLVWRPQRFAAAVVLGLVACLIRELAIAYLLVMVVMAVVNRSRSEARAWSAAIAVAIAALVAHIVAVSQFVSDGDPQSQGWLTVGGWGFTMRTVYNTTVIAPYELTALIIPLGLLGWLGVRDPLGLRVAGLCAGFLTAFIVLGRPENFYWGYIYSTPLVVGVAYAPLALWTLSRMTVRRQSVAERGAAFTEYVVLTAVVLLVIFVAVTTFRQEILAGLNDLFDTITSL